MFIKDHPPILDRKNQMIYPYRNIMTLMYIIAHKYILRRERRGITPKVIKKLPSHYLLFYQKIINFTINFLLL